MNKPKLLIVDDREENLLVLESVLSELDVELVRANSGMEALQCVARERFALVLMDVQMPEMDGFEAATLMRSIESTKDVPIIFVTAINREQEYVFKGYESGAVDYLFKPINADILKSKVNVFIGLYQKQYEIEKVNKQLAQSNQRMEEFVGIVAHDLRSPLGSIFSASDILLKGGLPEDVVKEFLTAMYDTAKRSMVMVNDLLELAALGTGKIHLNYTTFNMAELVESLIKENEYKSSAKSVSIVHDLDSSLCVNADVARLSQVISNLLTNAIKFSEKGTDVHLHLKKEADEVLLQVVDSGIGIPKSMIAELFNKEGRCSRYGTDGEKGTGFGLPLSQEIMRLHESKIDVESEEGKGSMFSIRLKAHE